MTEKETTMVLKCVDLKCPSCYKKIKKLLCKFPQIRDQLFDEKQNTVTIAVVCCSPEKIRDKLCCKGGKTIKSIEIIKPPPPKQPPPEKKKEPEKQKEAEKPKQLPAQPAEKKPKEGEKPKEAEKPKEKEPDKPKSNGKPPKETPPPPPADKPPKEAPKPEPAPAPPKAPPPEPVAPPPMPVACCGPCYEGHVGGPCFQGYARPVPWYDNYGYGPYCRCGGQRGGFVSRCDYFSEESTTGCTIM